MYGFSKRDVYIWLNNIRVSNKTISKLEYYFDDIREVLEASSLILLNIKGIRKDTINKILKWRNKDFIKKHY